MIDPAARADALIAVGDLDGAEAALTAALAATPTAALAAALAGVQARCGDPAAAATARAALAMDPDCALAHRYLAVALIQAGAPAAALPHARRAAAAAPADADALEVLGTAATGAGALPEAHAAFVRAAAAAPDRPGPWCNAGHVAAAVGDHAAAAAAFTRALDRAPDLAAALDGLARARTELGDDAGAAAAWQRLADLDPTRADAAHLAAALRREPRTAPPPGYVAQVFDAGAAGFDRLLVERLGYVGHTLVADAVGPGRFARGLDLGCGTGLVGVALGGRCAHLTGVDLSPRMLARAAATGAYHALACADAVAFLAASDARVDLVVAADVLIYVGDLAPLFAALAPRLAPGAIVAFTTEAGPGCTLERTGRWSHGAAYVEALAAAHHLAVEARVDATLRREPSGPVAGHAWRLRAR